jgi:hypothetical protein
MLQITLDLGSAPSVIEAMRDPKIAQKVVNAAAESFTDDVHDYIDSGQAFTPREGHLQQSINWRPGGNGSAEVYAQADYASYVEEGTRPHVILPREGRLALKIPVLGGGGYVLRRAVNHPGSRPHPFFFADQAARTEHMQDRAMSVLAGVIAHG